MSPSSFKLKLATLLIVIALITQLLSIYISTLIDHIVHSDLYQYGLEFDYSWANLYWNNFHLLLASMAIATLLIAISTTLILIYIKTNKKSFKNATYVFSLATIGLNFFAVSIFTRVDYIIHNTLYNYGLQFNLDWATSYWAYTSLLLTLIGITSTLALIIPLPIYIATKHTVEKPKIPETKQTLTTIKTTKSKPIKIRKKPARNRHLQLTSYSLVAIGAVALFGAIYFTSSILAFIGLGLLFWGILFAYIRTEEYAKKALLDAIAYSQTTILNQIINDMDYKGNPIYLPPKYFTNPENTKAYIPKQNETALPTPEQIQKQETQTFTTNPTGILITPPGAEVTKLFEKTLDTNFAKIDLQYLRQNLPRLLIEEFEIAQNLEMEIENQKITIKITEAANNKLSGNQQHPAPLTTILSSAIACALAKATGNPITIEKQETSSESGETTIEYRIITEEAQIIP